MYTYVYMYICIYVYMYICIYVYMYTCIYVYMYICIYVYMYICIHVYMYIVVSLYIGLMNLHCMTSNQPALMASSESSPSTAWPSCSLSTSSTLECGMPPCKRPIMPKTCMLHEATWNHDSNPCAHWFCWPRFGRAPRAPLRAPPLPVICSSFSTSSSRQLHARFIHDAHHGARSAPRDWCPTVDPTVGAA